MANEAKAAETVDGAEDNRLTISGFIRAMAQRFEDRTLMAGLSAVGYAVQTLEQWEADNPDYLEMTESCAHAIVDSELEHWEEA